MGGFNARIFAEVVTVEPLVIMYGVFFGVLNGGRGQHGVDLFLNVSNVRFATYQNATENILEKFKDAIYESILEQSDVSSWDYKKLIYVRGNPVTLMDFACEMYKNGHRVFF